MKSDTYFPNSILSLSLTFTSEVHPLSALMTLFVPGIICFRTPVPVTWSAWQCVLMAYFKSNPSCLIRFASRSAQTSTGSIRIAAFAARSASRYVYLAKHERQRDARASLGRRPTLTTAPQTAAERTGPGSMLTTTPSDARSTSGQGRVDRNSVTEGRTAIPSACC